MADVVVPPLGESITSGVISRWLKQVGEKVNADEPVVTLETDKVTVDVPSPASGALAAISHQEGETVKVGDVLGVVEAGAAAQAAAPPAPEQKQAPAPKDETPPDLL